MNENSPPLLLIVSGGMGASGEQLVRTVLAQFPDSRIPLETVSQVRHQEQIEAVVARAKATGGTIVHTLVDAGLRSALIELAQQQEVVHIDLVGPLVSRLSGVLGREPLEHPGRYRQLNLAYFERVAAIEFTMAHDDGKHPPGWPQADIVLTGVSRTGKTPLSMYLSVLGWKVANIPLVPGLPTPVGLFQLDPRRVFGLTIEPGQLVFYRQQRRRRLSAPGLDRYTDPAAIHQEVQAARRVFGQGGFSVIDVTDKPIETSAGEIVDRLTRRLGKGARTS